MLQVCDSRIVYDRDMILKTLVSLFPPPRGVLWHLSQMFSWNSANAVTKMLFISVKGFKPTTFCVGDRDATTAPARQMRETGSSNWLQSMLQWFIRFSKFTEFLFFLRKTPSISSMFGRKYCTSLISITFHLKIEFQSLWHSEIWRQDLMICSKSLLLEG